MPGGSVVAGRRHSSLARHHPSTLDPSFDGDGVAFAEFPTLGVRGRFQASADEAYGVVVQPDGKVRL